MPGLLCALHGRDMNDFARVHASDSLHLYRGRTRPDRLQWAKIYGGLPNER